MYTCIRIPFQGLRDETSRIDTSCTFVLSNRGNPEKKESLKKKRKFESTDLPSDPPAPDRRQTALFSHFDKNTVIEKKVSGHRVSLLVFLSTVSVYRVFVQFRNLYRVYIPAGMVKTGKSALSNFLFFSNFLFSPDYLGLTIITLIITRTTIT